MAQSKQNDLYDYIIVGAGSSGCVIAERLSRNPNKNVLLIEAGGPDKSPYIHMPKGIAKLVMDPKHIWAYTVAQPRGNSNEANEVWIRGRGLGGSSSINGMIWSRGEAADYDDWEALGCTGWNGDSMMQAFLDVEDHALAAKDENGKTIRGKGGPVKITPGEFKYPLAYDMVKAGSTLGLPVSEDLNAISGDRIGYYSHNIHKGKRQSAMVAFARPASSRSNLTIITDTCVDKILFDGKKAVGVQFVGKTSGANLTDSGEVIVSAGTMESPQILERSGVGDQKLLKRLNIPVVANSPDVGNCMEEHLCFSLAYRLKKKSGINSRFFGLGLIKSVLQYFFTKKGVMSCGPFEVGGFMNTYRADKRTDLQIYMSGYVFAIGDENHPVPLNEIDKQPGLSIYGSLFRLSSRGRVHISSPDASAMAVIEPNWLSTKDDEEAAIAAVKYMRSIVNQDVLADKISHELNPGKDIDTDAEILENFRTYSTSGLHGTGTCRMGGDKTSVVDPELRVRGVQGVRVVDCSVMPTTVTGNTNAPAIALAWRAASLMQA